MRTADKFKEKSESIKNTSKHFHGKDVLVPIGIMRGAIRRIEYLEEYLESELGYIPGKPIGKEHLNYKTLYGIDISLHQTKKMIE